MNHRKGWFSAVSDFLFGLLRDIGKSAKLASSAVSNLTEIQEESISTRGRDDRKRLSAVNFLNPVFLIVQGFGFALRFLTSRTAVSGLQGLPAICGVMAPLFFIVWGAPEKEEQAAYARGRMNFFQEQQDLKTAEFFARQVCFLKPNDADALLSRARLLHSLGKTQDALSIATQLGQESHVPSVEWLVQLELQQEGKTAEIDDARDRRILSGLHWILEQNPDHISANYMLGNFLLARKQYSRALPPLTRVSELTRPVQPEVWFSIAVAQQQLGKGPESQASASLAADSFLDRVSREEYDVKKVIQLLRAFLLAGREAEASAFLQQLIPGREGSEAAELKWLLGEVFAEWSKRLRIKEKRSADDFAQAMSLVYRAVAVAPNNPKVLDELVQLACLQDNQDNSLEEQLQIVLDSGVSPDLVHFIIGTRKLLGSTPDPEAALKEFKLANSHNSAYPGLLNNMADALVDSEQGDLEQALLLINQAIQMMADVPHFHDTKGKILLRKGDYVAAIAEFEKALAAPELRVSAHRKLGEAYQAIGDNTESVRHLKLAGDLQEQDGRQSPDSGSKSTQ